MHCIPDQLTNQDRRITSSDYLRLLAVKKKKVKLGSPSSRSGSFLFSFSATLYSSVFIAIHIPIFPPIFPPLPSSILLYYPNFLLFSILLVLYWFILVLLFFFIAAVVLLLSFNYLPTSIPTTLLLYYHAL